MADNIATPKEVMAALEVFLRGLSDEEKKRILQSFLSMTQS